MTTAQHITAAQNSPEWHAARAKIITASKVAKLLTAKWKVANNETSRGLVNDVAMARATGLSPDDFSTEWMQRGTEFEPIARQYYEDNFGLVQESGLFVAEISPGIICGASPDGLVGEDGLLEIKTRKPELQFATIMADEVPADYIPQIQFQLLVTNRRWVDFVSFCDGLPLYVRRVFPDLDKQAVLIAAVQSAEMGIAERVADYLKAAAGLVPTVRIPRAEADFSPTTN